MSVEPVPPLLYSMLAGDPEMSERLLRRGADPHYQLPPKVSQCKTSPCSIIIDPTSACCLAYGGHYVMAADLHGSSLTNRIDLLMRKNNLNALHYKNYILFKKLTFWQ